MSDSNKTTVADILHGIAETLQFMIDEPYTMTLELISVTASWIVEQLETPQVIEWQRDKELTCCKLAELHERMELIDISGIVFNDVPLIDIFEQPNPVYDERFFRRFVLYIQKLIPLKGCPKAFEGLPKPSKNPDRDDWIWKRKNEKASHSEIISELKTMHKEWEQIHTVPGISEVLKRMRKRKG